MTIGVRGRATDYVALAKPRLNLLVVVSAVAGYAMAHGDTTNLAALGWMVVGTGLVSGGASAINQVIERDTDGLMRRTRQRPLPDGRLTAVEALAFAGILSVTGLFVLAAGVNLLSAVVALATLASYAVVYTPLKRRTSFATVIGAIPAHCRRSSGGRPLTTRCHRGHGYCSGSSSCGSFPTSSPSPGCTARTTRVRVFPMLPVIEPDGRSTARQAVVYTAALLPLALAPTLVGMSGTAYFTGALIITLMFLGVSMRFAMTRAVRDARRLFFTSIIYLPVLWALMIVDRVIDSVFMASSKQRRFRSGLDQSDAPVVSGTPARERVAQRVATVLLIVGYACIRRRPDHRPPYRDGGSVLTSVLFLISYLIYHARAGSRPFPGRDPSGWSISRS